MRVKKEYQVITFHTTTQAMAMEKRCGEHGIPGRLIPVPTQITAGCGLAWRITVEDYEQNQEKLQTLDLKFERIVQMRL